MNENNNIEELKKSIQELEENFNNKINLLYKYKRIQITIKVITFVGISTFMFVRGGRHHDIYMWIIGFYLMLIAAAELFNLEEHIFISSENKKVFQKKTDKI